MSNPTPSAAAVLIAELVRHAREQLRDEVFAMSVFDIKQHLTRCFKHIRELADALEASQAVIAANDARELERQGNPFDSPQFELRTRAMDAEEKLESASADAAVLRQAVESELHLIQSSGRQNVEERRVAMFTAALATTAGRALLDEVALLRNCIGVAVDSPTSDFDRLEYTKVQMRAERAEADLAAARRDSERYQYVRRLNVNQFRALFVENLQGHKAFDDLVDVARNAAAKEPSP